MKVKYNKKAKVAHFSNNSATQYLILPDSLVLTCDVPDYQKKFLHFEQYAFTHLINRCLKT